MKAVQRVDTDLGKGLKERVDLGTSSVQTPFNGKRILGKVIHHLVSERDLYRSRLVGERGSKSPKLESVRCYQGMLTELGKVIDELNFLHDGS